MEIPPASPQHQWLRQLLGVWKFEFDEPSTGDHPGGKVVGTEEFRAVGDFWVVGEGRMEGTWGSCHSIVTLGFDPKTGRFTGSWVGSMSPYHWVYDGEFNAAANELILHCVGPRFDDPTQMTKYQDIEILHPDGRRTHRTMLVDAAGEWQQMMQIEYRRP